MIYGWLGELIKSLNRTPGSITTAITTLWLSHGNHHVPICLSVVWTAWLSLTVLLLLFFFFLYKHWGSRERMWVNHQKILLSSMETLGSGASKLQLHHCDHTEMYWMVFSLIECVSASFIVLLCMCFTFLLEMTLKCSAFPQGFLNKYNSVANSD